MKKLVSGVLVLLTVAAAAFFILKVRQLVPERSRALELAPAETILFVHAPNLPETAKRFRKTGLFAIWQEPEVQDFLEKPRKTAPLMKLWEERLTRLARVVPGEAFVAVTAVDGLQPRFVAGFSFAGKRRDVEGWLAQPREDFQRRWPAGTSSSATHKGAAIEIFTYPDGLLAECFVRNWYFLASDTTLLRATIDRYENSALPVAGGLAADATFQKTTAALGSGSDLIVFGLIEALRERFGALMAAPARPANREKIGAEETIQAIAAATRIDGTQMRDTVFILSPQDAAGAPLSRSTLALSGPETFLYFAMGMTSLTQVPEPILAVAAVLPGAAAMEAALTERKLAWSDFGAAFGPEFGTTVGWPDDAAFPSLLMGLEVRDSDKARGFVEAVASGGDGARAWVRREEAGTAYFSSPGADTALAEPTIAITPQYALFGFSAEGVAAGLRKMEAARGGNQEASPFEEAAKQLSAPTAGFGYLDTAALFERAYRTLRPALTMSLALSEDLGDFIDAGKLPSAETISRHLTPSVFSQSATTSGILMESAGTLTFNQLILGMTAGAATAFPTHESPVETAAARDELPDDSAAKTNGAPLLLQPVAAPAGDLGSSDVSPGRALDAAIPAR